MVSRILSADSHVLEPPDLWTTRMQPRFRDRAPHLEHECNGQIGDFLVCDPLRPFNPTSLGCAGVPPEDVDHLMWGSDYPHFDSTFPKSREAVERNLQDVHAPVPQPVAV
ncbi:MAG TPA: hypothetical protein VGE94_12495 [Chloroflexota bacterium]|jgi:hypothetical protein